MTTRAAASTTSASTGSSRTGATTSWPGSAGPDAEARGIRDDDLVRLWNRRGSVVCAAHVTHRIQPGIVSAYAGSAQYQPVGEPGRSTDLGGCVNMLCPSESITKKGHGIKPNTVLVQIEKWTGVDTWQPAETA